MTDSTASTITDNAGVQVPAVPADNAGIQVPAVPADNTGAQVPSVTADNSDNAVLQTIHGILHRLIVLAHVSDDERRSLHADLNTIIDPSAPSGAEIKNKQEIEVRKQRLAQLQAELTELEGK